MSSWDFWVFTLDSSPSDLASPSSPHSQHMHMHQQGAFLSLWMSHAPCCRPFPPSEEPVNTYQAHIWFSLQLIQIQDPIFFFPAETPAQFVLQLNWRVFERQRPQFIFNSWPTTDPHSLNHRVDVQETGECQHHVVVMSTDWSRPLEWSTVWFGQINLSLSLNFFSGKWRL